MVPGEKQDTFIQLIEEVETLGVDLRIICPQKTQFFAKVNLLINIKGVIQCENYVSHWITPLIILNITIK